MKRPGSRVVGDANPYEKNGSRGEAGKAARLRAAEGVGPYGERDGVRKNAPGGYAAFAALTETAEAE